jgi:hypothetical protein
MAPVPIQLKIQTIQSRMAPVPVRKKIWTAKSSLAQAPAAHKKLSQKLKKGYVNTDIINTKKSPFKAEKGLRQY